MTNKDLAELINNFFNKYLSKERRFSCNTYNSYLIVIKLYISYLKNIKNIKIVNLNIEAFGTKDNVKDFLNYLDEVKKLKPISINHHLSVLKTFLDYCQSINIIYSKYYIEISSIKKMKEEIKMIDYLTIEEFEAYMNTFNLQNKSEYKHFIMITTLYETGCRVSELINIKVEDIHFGQDSFVNIIGKGNKERIVYISKSTERVIQKYIEIFNIKSGYIFLNHGGDKFTRFGLNKIIEKYTERACKICESIKSKNITPHVFRHTKAVHFLINGTPLPIIQKFLGHSQISTTEIYLNVTSDMVINSVNKLNELINYNSNEKELWTGDKNLVELISSLTNE